METPQKFETSRMPYSIDPFFYKDVLMKSGDINSNVLKVLNSKKDPDSNWIKGLSSLIQRVRDGQFSPAMVSQSTIDRSSAPEVALEQTYNIAKRAKPGFDDVIKSITESHGGEAVLCPLKTKESAKEKAKVFGSIPIIKDVLRNTILCDSIEEIPDIIGAIDAHEKVQICTIDDRIITGKEKPSGYADVKLYLEYTLDTGEKYIAETQIHLRKMYEVKNNLTDKLYKAIGLLLEEEEELRLKSTSLGLNSTEYQREKNQIIKRVQGINKKIDFLENQESNAHSLILDQYKSGLSSDAIALDGLNSPD
ncbi:hypothetical protein HON22_04630 [Candidatus Peregrinibacteria bacterium]|jgi:hypothetical protein|nr:hypothetical protein [Candidatus Peregrinibacteria bacterium]